VADALPSIDRILGERIELRANCESRPAVVYSDPTAIEQMLMNLALNARDSIRGGGRLSIETVRIDPREDPMGFSPPSPGCGCLIVSNTGAGGLGLASVAFTANQFNGRLRLEIRPGGGTRIAVELPLAIEPD
jgi:signal transduction histidine kinase